MVIDPIMRMYQKYNNLYNIYQLSCSVIVPFHTTNMLFLCFLLSDAAKERIKVETTNLKGEKRLCDRLSPKLYVWVIDYRAFSNPPPVWRGIPLPLLVSCLLC